MAKIEITPIETEAAPTADAPLKEKIIYALRNVYDPELPVNVYDLGLVYDIKIMPATAGKSDVVLTYTLTAPNCPVAHQIPADMIQGVQTVTGVGEVRAELTFSPPWHKNMMSEAAALELGYL